MRSWNPRYAAYAAAHGLTPDEMLAEDTAKWPGGRMTGFLIWISEQWDKWHAEHGLKRHVHVLSEEAHKSFDEQLELVKNKS